MRQIKIDDLSADLDELMTDPFPEYTVDVLIEWLDKRINDESIPITDDRLASIIESKSYYDPKTEFLLGILYEKGIGVDGSPEKAEEHILMSAAKGYGDARFYLAFCYEDGVFGEPNYFKAAKWFSKAADSGIEEAYLHYGRNCLKLYEETKLDYFSEEAISALWTVAYDMPDANAELARCYMRGIGTDVSLDTAKNMIDFLESEGHDVSQLKKEYDNIERMFNQTGT